MQLIDTHAHLDHIKNLPAAIENAVNAGVCSVVAVSEGYCSSRRNLEISKEFKDCPLNVYPAIGIHPSEADLEDVGKVQDLIRENASYVKAVGEIGLDYWYKWVRKDEDRRKRQQQVFISLLKLAMELDIPVIIHSRGASNDCVDITLGMGIKKAVFHWYSGPLDVLDRILEAGYYISATPSLRYSPQSQDAVRHAPLSRILIETDSPVYYKSSQSGNDGFYAEPKDVFRVFDAYVRLLGKENVVEVAEAFNHNASNFFNLM